MVEELKSSEEYPNFDPIPKLAKINNAVARLSFNPRHMKIMENLHIKQRREQIEEGYHTDFTGE